MSVLILNCPRAFKWNELLLLAQAKTFASQVGLPFSHPSRLFCTREFEISLEFTSSRVFKKNVLQHHSHDYTDRNVVNFYPSATRYLKKAPCINFSILGVKGTLLKYARQHIISFSFFISIRHCFHLEPTCRAILEFYFLRRLSPYLYLNGLGGFRDAHLKWSNAKEFFFDGHVCPAYTWCKSLWCDIRTHTEWNNFSAL